MASSCCDAHLSIPWHRPPRRRRYQPRYDCSQRQANVWTAQVAPAAPNLQSFLDRTAPLNSLDVVAAAAAWINAL
jgi:hypothetical protein